MTKEYLQDDLRVFVVPTDILKVEGLSIYEKMVYMVLRSFCNSHDATAFPSYPTIAKLGSMSERQAIRVVQSLIDKGLIKKEKRLDVTKNRKIRDTSNLYTIKTPRVTKTQPKEGDSQSPRGVTVSQGVGDSQSPENNHLKKPSINNGWMEGSQPTSPLTNKPLAKEEYEWTLFHDTCRQYDIDNATTMDLWKICIYQYSEAPISSARAIIREMMNDKIDFQGREKKYKNLAGLFHHRMKAWKSFQIALNDVESNVMP